MPKINIRNAILELIGEHKTISSKKLFELLQEYDPDLKYSTLKWRIYSLKEQDLIKNAGRGLYEIGNNLPEFSPPIKRKIRLINNHINKLFPYLDYSIWTTQWLCDYMLHQPMSYITLIDVDPDASSSVFNKLRNKWNNTKVLFKPDADEFDRYAIGIQNLIIVKDLVSESPLRRMDGVPTPMIEKIIVDIFTEKIIFAAYRGKELSIIFNELNSKFSINKTKLLRYAQRRKCVSELLAQLNLFSNESQGIINDYR